MGHRIKQQRLIETAAILQEEVNLIDEGKVDKAFLWTEHFFDILRIAVENCLKTRHKERIRINCKILVGAINNDKKQDRHYAEEFLYCVANLTPEDIRVGYEIYKAQENWPKQFDMESQDNTELKYVIKSGWGTLEENSPVKGLGRDIALHKLSAAGLIREVVGAYVGYTAVFIS